MGMTPQFPLSCEEVTAAIEDYKAKVESGVHKRADFWHFCGEIGVDAQSVVDVIKEPNKKNMELAGALKKFVTWLQGQYLTAPGWGGPNSSKAIFALKQDLGGLVLTDKREVDNKVEAKINVKFGQDDAFG